MRSLIVLVTLALSHPLPAQDDKKDAPPPVERVAERASLQLTDGSLLRCAVLSNTIEFKTEYGVITVPVADILSIDLGVHYTERESAELDQWLKDLGDMEYGKREAASKGLTRFGPRAYRRVLPYVKHEALEVAKRSAKIVDNLRAAYGDACDRPAYDILKAKDFTGRGQLLLKTLKIESALGKSIVYLGEVQALRFSPESVLLRLDADKDWVDTGVTLSLHHRTEVIATGEVDLWPAIAGQYKAKARGYTATGKGGVFMAGALIGKIDDGGPFVIGENHALVGKTGRLYLQIVPSPWNNQSSGGYDVQILHKFGK